MRRSFSGTAIDCASNQPSGSALQRHFEVCGIAHPDRQACGSGARVGLSAFVGIRLQNKIRSAKTLVLGLMLAGGCLAETLVFPGNVWGQSGPAPAVAETAKPIGKVVNVSGSAYIERTGAVVLQARTSSGGPAAAKVDDLVFIGDIVQTAADGVIGIIFGDGTSFNVSSNARMEINEFIYNPKGTSNSTLFRLTKGTFTMLAGKTAKTGNMKVETPVGTMGIRGTAPHVEISDNGTVKFSTLVEEKKHEAGQVSTRVVAPVQTPRKLPSYHICRNC